jgi:general secretion pathway protein D
MLKNSVNHSRAGAVVAQRLSRVGELLVVCRLARRPAFRALLAGAAIAVCGALLSACNLTVGGESGTAPPDAVDRVRQADLQPRFPAPSEGANTGAAGGPRATSYYGSRPIETAAPVPTPGGGEGYEFNFENTPVITVAKVILGDILGAGYTIDPRVQGTVSLTSGRPVPKSDVLYVLESALRTSNVALVRERTGYRLVPAPEAIGSAAVDPQRDPEAGYGITVIPLQYVSVQTVSKLIDSFAAKPGSIRADQSRNLLLVQGTAAERRAALDTVLSFDRDWMRGQSVGIYPIRNTTPEPVMTELEKIIDSGENGLNQNLVKLQAIARMNAILVVSKKPELLRTVATWINRLDNSETASTGVKVYRVRYGDARQIARLLNDIFLGSGGGAIDTAANQIAPGAGLSGMSTFDRLTGASQGSTGVGGSPTPPNQAPIGSGFGGSGLVGPGGTPSPTTGGPIRGGGTETPGAPSNTLAPGPAAGGGPGGSGAVLPGVRITADVVNNALLIYSNRENYLIIERAIHQLDRPLLQVAIDLTIAEVTLNDKLGYGVQTLLTSANLGLPTGTGQAINTAVAQPLAQVFPGANILVGTLANPQIIINALHTYTDVKVLSNPSLVVLDHQVATLQVGDQVPITTGTATVLSANNAVVNTINYQNTGIILRVVPRINSNGKVTLDIEQEISNVSPSSQTGSLTPTISQRRVKSSISVVTGQTVLLAGLISETQSRARNSIPFLDQVPVLGDAASTLTQKSLARTELIIFIRPQVIRDSVDAAAVAEELRSRMRGGKYGQSEPVPGAAESPSPQVLR